MFNNNSSFLSFMPPVVRNLLIINVLCWFAAIILGNKFDLNYYLGMHYWQADDFNPAQIITYMFMHSTQTVSGGIDISHIFFNMFALYMFGRVLEQTMGSKRFLIYYIITGIGAALVQQIIWSIDLFPLVQEAKEQFTGDRLTFYLQPLNHFVTIGASGAVFGILLAFGLMFPNIPLYIMFIPVPIKAKYVIIGYAVIELFFGVANFSGDNVAHFAHLGGMLFGFLLLFFWRKQQWRY